MKYQRSLFNPSLGKALSLQASFFFFSQSLFLTFDRIGNEFSVSSLSSVDSSWQDCEFRILALLVLCMFNCVNRFCECDVFLARKLLLVVNAASSCSG